MSTSSILLKSGTVLFHDKGPKPHVTPLLNTDVLLEEGLIKEIGTRIHAPIGTTVIDCAGKIISPGFISTHHHLWQTQLKGRHANHTLLQYMYTGNMACYAYKPNDIFWGQLAGCLESINAGTTTVLDHSHGAYTPGHSTCALSASASSGIRTIFAYMTYMPRFSEWTKTTIKPEPDFLPEWPLEQLESWCAKQPFAAGRVQLGFAFDFFFLPPPLISSIFERVRKSPIKLITSHVGKTSTMGTASPASILEGIGQLNGLQVFSHANNFTTEEYSTLAAHGIGISTTPCTEYQIGNTNPVALHPTITYPHVSLGVDCHSASPSSMPAQSRAALLSARAIRAHSMYEKQDRAEPRLLHGSPEEAFNLITLNGAQALGMGDEIGSIAVGKKADLVIFDARSPNMLCAGEHDPVAAVVMHSDVADVETVIIDGVIRKQNGKLGPIEYQFDIFDANCDNKVIEWKDVAAELVRSRHEVQDCLDRVSEERAREFLVNAWHIDESKLV